MTAIYHRTGMEWRHTDYRFARRHSGVAPEKGTIRFFLGRRLSNFIAWVLS